MGFLSRTVLSVHTTLRDNVRDLGDIYIGLKGLRKPTELNDEQDEDIYQMEADEYIRMRSIYMNDAKKPLAVLLSTTITVILAIWGISKLAVGLYAYLLFKWYTSLGFKVSVICVGIIIAFGVVAYIINIINGRQIKQELSDSEKDNLHHLYAEIVTDIFRNIADSVGLASISHTADVNPTVDKHYQDGLTIVYVYSLLKMSDVDAKELYKLFESQLFRHPRVKSIGIYTLQGRTMGGVIPIDLYHSDSNYLRLELATTDSDAYDLQRRRSLRRTSGLVHGKVHDNEF
jgi:hypothetical protein